MPLAALVILFIVVPIAELYVIIEVVGEALGAPLTVLLLAVDSVVGSILLRNQGRAVWAQFNQALAAGRIPHVEVLDGVLVIFGGAFLITPGFITDVVGLFLLVPPTRALARRLVTRLAGRALFLRAGSVRVARQRPPDWDVDGSATENQPHQLER